MKKILYSLMFLVTAAGLQSCLHDNEDNFSESASERLANTVKKERTILESASNGWLLQYFAGENYQNGGYNFILRFKDGKVTASGEISADSLTYSSDYDIITDQGPVLTFNTYNELLHYLAQPYQDNVEGLQGDYEFVIEKASQDTVVLKGKKWGNYMRLIRMNDGISWKDCLDRISGMADSISWTAFNYSIGGDSVAKVSIDMPNRVLTLTNGTDVSSMGFVVTDYGIRLGDYISVNGTSVRDLKWDGATKSFTDTNPSSNVSMHYYYPAGYHLINDYAGTYTFSRNTKYGTSFTIVLTPNSTKTALVGVPQNNAYPYNIRFAYSSRTGKISLGYQKLTDYTANGASYGIYLCPWDATQGYFSWSPSIAMEGEMKSDGSVQFSDNGVWGSYSCNSFLVAGFSGTPSESTYSSTITSAFSSYRIIFFYGLVKVK
jgi:hypothetical protein